MSYCDHPDDRVTYDVTQGDWAFHSVQWCQVCGAFRVSVHTREESVSPTKYVSPWTLPQDQEQSRLGAR